MMNLYHKLLEIPESETPPDHYGLLGVPRFCDDAQQIHAALVARNSQLRAWDNSKFYLEANALLDEVVAASFILEDPLKKAAYDAELRELLGLSEPKPVAVVVPIKVVEEPPATELPEEPNAVPLLDLPAHSSKMSEADSAQRDEVPLGAEAGVPKTSFGRRFLKLGVGLIAVSLLIAVPLMMWTGQEPAPVVRPNQSVATAPDPDWDPATVRELTTLIGHSGSVTSVAFSADGSRLASASEDKTVKVWSLSTHGQGATSGRESLKLSGHTGPVWSVAFSADGNRLASAGGDKTVKVWDAASGLETLTLPGHTSPVTSVAFSPDGKRLASASLDQTVKVWDAANGQETLTLSGHTGGVTSVAFSPDGKRLASASMDQTVKVWDAASGQVILTLKGNDLLTSVAFSPDGKRLASAGGDQTVTVWDVASGQVTLTLKGDAPLTSVVFSPDGKRLASGGDQTVKVWDAASGHEMITLPGHTGGITNVTFSADGKRLASASDDQTVKVWGADRFKTESSKSPAKPKLTETTPPAPNPDGDPVTVRELALLTGHTDRVMSVAFNPDGKRLASAGDDRTVKVWDATSGQTLLTWNGNSEQVYSVAYSPDGKRLASAGNDHTVRVWDALSGRETLTLKGHTHVVWSVAFNPDGKRLASASHDHTVKVWDIARGQAILTLNGHTLPVMSVVFSPDGKQLASSSQDGTVKLWNTTNGREMFSLNVHTRPVRCVAFSPDGTRLVSGSDAGMLTVWDSNSGEVTLTLQAHSAFVMSVAFSPDGNRLASASLDGSVKIRDATSGQETHTLLGHTGGVASVAFSSDGKRLASAGYDQTVRVWGVDRTKAGSSETPAGPNSTATPGKKKPAVEKVSVAANDPSGQAAPASPPTPSSTPTAPPTPPTAASAAEAPAYDYGQLLLLMGQRLLAATLLIALLWLVWSFGRSVMVHVRAGMARGRAVIVGMVVGGLRSVAGAGVTVARMAKWTWFSIGGACRRLVSGIAGVRPGRRSWSFFQKRVQPAVAPVVNSGWHWLRQRRLAAKISAENPQALMSGRVGLAMHGGVILMGVTPAIHILQLLTILSAAFGQIRSSGFLCLLVVLVPAIVFGVWKLASLLIEEPAGAFLGTCGVLVGAVCLWVGLGVCGRSAAFQLCAIVIAKGAFIFSGVILAATLMCFVSGRGLLRFPSWASMLGFFTATGACVVQAFVIPDSMLWLPGLEGAFTRSWSTFVSFQMVEIGMQLAGALLLWWFLTRFQTASQDHETLPSHGARWGIVGASFFQGCALFLASGRFSMITMLAWLAGWCCAVIAAYSLHLMLRRQRFNIETHSVDSGDQTVPSSDEPDDRKEERQAAPPKKSKSRHSLEVAAEIPKSIPLADVAEATAITYFDGQHLQPPETLPELPLVSETPSEADHPPSVADSVPDDEPS